jgi:hypothetical protein
MCVCSSRQQSQNNALHVAAMEGNNVTIVKRITEYMSIKGCSVLKMNAVSACMTGFIVMIHYVLPYHWPNVGYLCVSI